MPPPLLSPLCPPSLRHRVPTGDSWGIFTFLCAALCNLPALPALNCTEELGAGQSIQKTYDLTRYLEHQLRTLAGTYVSRSSPAPYPLPAPPPCTGMEIGGGGCPVCPPHAHLSWEMPRLVPVPRSGYTPPRSCAHPFRGTASPPCTPPVWVSPHPGVRWHRADVDRAWHGVGGAMGGSGHPHREGKGTATPLPPAGTPPPPPAPG